MASGRSPTSAPRRGAWRSALAPAALALVTAAASAQQPVTGTVPSSGAASARLADGDGESRGDASLVVASAQSDGALSGSVHGVLDVRFADLSSALAEVPAWCELLILDPNVHRCRRLPATGAAQRLELAFGQSEAPVVMTFTRSSAPDHLRVGLAASDGPFGTRDYAMTLEAAPRADGRSAVRLGFAQQFGLAARLAMLAYFNTVGRGKVGFTVVAHDANGQPARVTGLRGGLERNLVRQWLALDAYLATRAGAPADLAERRVRRWLAGTERFPLQLREEDGYLARKVPEVRRQLSGG